MTTLAVPQITLSILTKSLLDNAPRRFPINRIFCVARNYRDHVIEMGNDPDREPPCFFMKPADAAVDTSFTTNSNGNVIIPYAPMTKSLHYEAELVVAIGKEGIRIQEENANEHIFGYCVGCDLTRRDLQSDAKKLGLPWTTAKAFDYSAPMGSIIPKHELTDNQILPSNAKIALSVNGEIRQDSTIDKMIWNIPELISNLSRYFRLKPGDLIMTGTPAGVGTVNVGDTVDITCGGLPRCTFTLGEPE